MEKNLSGTHIVSMQRTVLSMPDSVGVNAGLPDFLIKWDAKKDRFQGEDRPDYLKIALENIIRDPNYSVSVEDIRQTAWKGDHIDFLQANIIGDFKGVNYLFNAGNGISKGLPMPYVLGRVSNIKLTHINGLGDLSLAGEYSIFKTPEWDITTQYYRWAGVFTDAASITLGKNVNSPGAAGHMNLGKVGAFAHYTYNPQTEELSVGGVVGAGKLDNDFYCPSTVQLITELDNVAVFFMPYLTPFQTTAQGTISAYYTKSSGTAKLQVMPGISSDIADIAMGPEIVDGKTGFCADVFKSVDISKHLQFTGEAAFSSTSKFSGYFTMTLK